MGLYNYLENNISIFNRWGSKVFYTENYDGTWNGSTNGSDLLPAGVYFYVLTLKTNNQGKEVKKGTVYIHY